MSKQLTDLFTDVPDPRMVNKCAHKLSDILLIALCTLICNGEDYEDMALFGQEHFDWLNSILDLPNGIPSHDTFNRVLQLVEPDLLSKVLEKDGQLLLDTLHDKQICLDGKKAKGVSPKSKGNKGFYILNAWVCESKICVGQKKVDDKSNEITAIPELLDSIEIASAVVSIDAIGCQKAIAKKILSKKGMYFLALKMNQKETYQRVTDAFRLHEPKLVDVTTDKGHGRQEERKCSIIHVDSLPPDERPHGWEGLQTLVRIQSTRTINGEVQQETRYYLSSERLTNPCYYNMVARGHWGVENELHWHLDVTFKEDACRARKANAPMNLNILRKIALQRINLKPDKLSKKKRRYKASMNKEYLEELLII